MSDLAEIRIGEAEIRIGETEMNPIIELNPIQISDDHLQEKTDEEMSLISLEKSKNLPPTHLPSLIL
jgi:hypothetical protein